MEEITASEPRLSKREIRKLIAPFLRKELDLQEVTMQCAQLEHSIFDHPEFYPVFAEKLGFNTLVVDGCLEPPLGRDPRNIFEKISYNQETGVYRPSGHIMLVNIVAKGMPEAAAKVVLNSVFSPECRGTFPRMNMSLDINWGVNSLPQNPSWVQQMPCFQGRDIRFSR